MLTLLHSYPWKLPTTKMIIPSPAFVKYSKTKYYDMLPVLYPM